ncbi:BTAD domain-containing putative transcriptional regulator [Streptomyces sp. NPDC051211]|uniref:BTAD domain-containing putative transcriptional regulator n=1 Tax=Streptomyces sp. NPDC051211 TaxID=3154643 RepID=UPI0034509548
MEFAAPADGPYDFRILGPVEVHDRRTGSWIAPPGPKQRILLAALVVRAGEVLTADRLVDELWGDVPPMAAANALQAHVARLRRLLQAPGEGGQDRIATHPMGYLLRPGRTATDAQQFHRLSAEGRDALAADPARAAAVLRRALDLWRGPALEDCGRGAICAREADRLEELRLTTLETLYEAGLRVPGVRPGELAAELERLTADHPTHERFYDLLMTALHRAGRRTEALGVYERARRRLLSELGVEPGPALRGRMETILRNAPAGPPNPGAPGGPRDPGPADEALPAFSPDAAALLDLGTEIARLRRHVETLSRAHQELARRIDAQLGSSR